MSKVSIRNRIKEHRRVRAGDLVPHEWNFRSHPEEQKATLAALYEQVGFARSLLAYELPDGRLKLIDGHLRRDIDPEMEVDVEVLDVNEEEARTLLLSIDPLAELAETQSQLHQRLMEQTPVESQELQTLWQRTAQAALEERPTRDFKDFIGEFYLLITCKEEKQQTELLERFHAEGLECRAVLS